MYTALYAGTIIFFGLGFFFCFFCGALASAKSKTRQEKFENKSIAVTSVSIATICMWLMWICTYMHQMNPLITPILEE